MATETVRTFVIYVAIAVLMSLVAQTSGQADVTDADLEAATGGRVVRVGPAAGGGRVATWPLEVYVARVLAGEAEPRAADAAFQALGVAIRTFAVTNAGRHAREGFDLCDGTHCQVPRAATPATRRAALATAGQVLTWNGAPAEVFYSASCGGHSESPDQVWPGADYPYMRSAPDDVHEGDEPWTLDLTLREIQRALADVGFRGRLGDVDVDDRSPSGRVTRLRVSGLQPAVIAGDQFRAAIGPLKLPSTAFSIGRRGSSLRFTGRGYGHGVGMCVIGAGRRAARGESVRAILAQYYPGLEVTRVGGAPVETAVAPLPTAPVPPAAGRLARGGIVVEVPRSSAMTEVEVARLTARAHDDLAKVLGTSVAPLTVRVHESLERFRLATGRPWWVSNVSEGTEIDLVPAALLAQRDGFEAALRIAVAELLLSEALKGRPLWIRIGAARYFGRNAPSPVQPAGSRDRCPSDAELTLAISAPAQRDAEARAEACFAREYVRTRDWRAVR
ncbi:MAG: SpoIID/LytB domain-containing protein [Acidobacteria bacterium]|nr:SpoIID/LytB domain-containing protein [Acidobacteriota bacterium]